MVALIALVVPPFVVTRHYDVGEITECTVLEVLVHEHFLLRILDGRHDGIIVVTAAVAI